MGGCRRVRNKLPLLAGGELDPREATAVHAHVDQCPSCARVLTELYQTREHLALLASWDREQPCPTVVTDVLAGIRHLGHTPATTAWPWSRLFRWALPVLAVAVASLVAAVWLLHPEPTAVDAAPATTSTDGALRQPVVSVDVQPESAPSFPLELAARAGSDHETSEANTCTYRLDLADAVSVTPVQYIEF